MGKVEIKGQTEIKVSIVILTFNRKKRVLSQVEHLRKITFSDIEIIFVDNFSEEKIDDIVKKDSRIVVIRNDKNYGAVGRNSGIAAAKGEIVITLDDDVYGLTDEHVELIVSKMKDESVAAINFRIIDEKSGNITDWCHPYESEVFQYEEFDTNDISEGAVALKNHVLKEVGLYPEYFFLSHEGPDLAFRMINKGHRVIYSPEILVMHGYEQIARAGWRRYYFDTRNQFWFVLRNLSFWYGLKRLVVGWGAMFVFSLRDGYFRYWLLAVFDSMRGAVRAWKDRTPPSARARAIWQQIEKQKPGFWKMVKKRLFSKEVRI